jgi:Ca2+-binding EF-hand superfamily protein
VFEQFDSDGGGSIDVDELRMAMKSLGQNLTKAEAEALMLELDTGGDGTIEFQEFVEFIKPRILSQDFEEEVKGQFTEFASVPTTDESGRPQRNRFDDVEMAYVT